MQSGGVDVLRLTTPADSKCLVADGFLNFNHEQTNEVEFWLVPGATPFLLAMLLQVGFGMSAFNDAERFVADVYFARLAV